MNRTKYTPAVSSSTSVCVVGDDCPIFENTSRRYTVLTQLETCAGESARAVQKCELRRKSVKFNRVTGGQ
jgi:hypothetical protein